MITLSFTGETGREIATQVRSMLEGFNATTSAVGAAMATLPDRAVVVTATAEVQSAAEAESVVATKPEPTTETTEQKRKRRTKVEMEAAKAWETLRDKNAVAAQGVLETFEIAEVADIGPDRATDLVKAVEMLLTAPTEATQTAAPNNLVGDVAEESPTPAPAPAEEPWLLKDPDGNRYDAYSSAEEWCDSLRALFANADKVSEIKALATVNGPMKERFEAAGKIDILRTVIDFGRTRMVDLEKAPAPCADAQPTVQDCAAALRAFLDPNDTGIALQSDERMDLARKVMAALKVGKVAELKPEQYPAFVAAMTKARSVTADGIDAFVATVG